MGSVARRSAPWLLGALLGGSVVAAVLTRAPADGQGATSAPEPPGAAMTEGSGPAVAHGAQADDTQADDAHGGPHQPEPPPQVPADAPLVTQRQARAEPEVLADGTVSFRLTAQEIRWELVPGTTITAWGYNGQVPGPELWVDQGDRVRIELTNHLPVPTTIHWHGLAVPNEMDGVPGVTQDPVQPGETFVYEFDAEPSGTFWYHSHFDSIRQLDMGLSGAFVVRDPDDPVYDRDVVVLLDEWIRLPDGRNGWEGVGHAGHNTAEYGWFTINGKAHPATEDLVVQEGERVRVRVVNAGYQNHPMHLHGKRFTVVTKDGAPLPSAYEADTVLVGAGERYDLEFLADDPGEWMFHCHILHHVANDGVEPGGLMTFVRYEGHRNAYRRDTGGGG